MVLPEWKETPGEGQGGPREKGLRLFTVCARAGLAPRAACTCAPLRPSVLPGASARARRAAEHLSRPCLRTDGPRPAAPLAAWRHRYRMRAQVHVRRGAPDVQDPGLNSHSKINCITACIQARTMFRAAARERCFVRTRVLCVRASVRPQGTPAEPLHGQPRLHPCLEQSHHPPFPARGAHTLAAAHLLSYSTAAPGRRPPRPAVTRR